LGARPPSGVASGAPADGKGDAIEFYVSNVVGGAPNKKSRNNFGSPKSFGIGTLPPILRKPMKPTYRLSIVTAAIISAAFISGCETTDSSNSAAKPSAASTPAAAPTPAPSPAVKSSSITSDSFSARYKTTDGRDIDIGSSRESDGGVSFKDPHMTKCWIANGFDFKGYGSLLIEPTLSTAKFHDDEAPVHDIAKQNVPVEFQRMIQEKGIFRRVDTSGMGGRGHLLKLENTIVEFHKGGGAARYFAGLYGAGQPVLRIQGKFTDNGRTVCTFDIRRSGTSAAARMGGGFMKDEDVQLGDIRSMAIDLSDFMAAVAGKYQTR
jgi:hypothetical protein